MYIEDEVISAHHFRSCALYKKDIDIKYERGLSKIGFREESFFSLRALWKGYKIGVDTQAIAYHLRTPSGGCRANDYAQLIAGDDFIFSKWVKRQFKTKGNPLEAK